MMFMIIFTMKEMTKAFALHVTFWKRESTNIIYGERCNLERERERTWKYISYQRRKLMEIQHT